MSTVSGRTLWKKAFIQTVRRMPRGANVISICPILMAMSFHLLVRSSGPLRAQGESPLQRPEQEFAGELANPVLGFFGEYCAIVSKTNPATLIAVGITPGDVPRRGGTPATTGLGRRIENGVQIIPRLPPKTFRAGTSAITVTSQLWGMSV